MPDRVPELDPGQMANRLKYESRLFLLTDSGSVAGDPVRARHQGGAQQGASGASEAPRLSAQV